MKHLIIEIKSLSEAQPKYKTWYKYYNDILVSAICTHGKRSYVRKKVKSEYHKTDNDMCFWHSDWQYSRIESYYGIEKTGVKTYEIIIQHNNETHRIDSLVNNIAIEFQHSLNVSLNEMNSRFTAHKAVGYTPYLVLDFTDFIFLDTLLHRFNFKVIEKNNFTRKDSECYDFLTRIRKWYNTEYYKNANIFIDFKDQMIRLVPKLEKGIIVFERDYFLNSLDALENQILLKIELEREQKRLENKIREENAILRREREIREQNDRYNELRIKNKYEIKENPEFHLYRQCLVDKTISENLPKDSEFEIVKYSSLTSIQQGLYLKHHFYRYFESQFKSPFFILEYTTFNRSLPDSKQKEYLWSEIVLKKPVGTELRTIRFIRKKGENVTLHSKRFELIEGYLHSVNNPALREYDNHGKLIKSEFYLFNVKIDNEEDWSNLSVYCEHGSFFEQTDEIKYKAIIERFSREDKWNMQGYFFENKHCKGINLMPDFMRRKYYEDKGLIKFYMDNYSELTI